MQRDGMPFRRGRGGQMAVGYGRGYHGRYPDHDSGPESSSDKGQGRGPPNPPPRRTPSERDTTPQNPCQVPPHLAGPEAWIDNAGCAPRAGSLAPSAGQASTIAVANDHYNTIFDMIQDIAGTCLDKAITTPSNLRMKGTTPPKYKGEDDEFIFRSWLMGFARHLRIGHLVGPDNAEERLIIMGSALEGSALDWYNLAVESLPDPAQNWTLVTALCAMYRHFVHKATTQKAAEQFEEVQYNADKGVSMYLNDLRDHAKRMHEFPDAYTFKCQFIRGLPYEMAQHLMMRKSLSAEALSTDDLLNACLEYENGKQFMKGHIRQQKLAGIVSTRPASNSSGNNNPQKPHH